MEKQKYQQRFYDEVEKALKKHVKKNNITGEIIGETGTPNADTVSYYLVSAEGKRLILKAKLTYKPLIS